MPPYTLKSLQDADSTATEEPNGEQMSRGIKIFIVASVVIVLALVATICYSLISQRHRHQLQTLYAAQAKEFLEKSDRAFSARDYVTADEMLSRSKQYADKMRLPDHVLLAEIDRRRGPIQQKLIQHRAEIEAHRRQQEERERQRYAAEQKRIQEQQEKEQQAAQARLAAQQATREQAAALEQARRMYPAYKESAAALADEILKFISATQTGLSRTQHSERLQNLQFVYNNLNP